MKNAAPQSLSCRRTSFAPRRAEAAEAMSDQQALWELIASLPVGDGPDGIAYNQIRRVADGH